MVELMVELMPELLLSSQPSQQVPPLVPSPRAQRPIAARGLGVARVASSSARR